MMLRSRALSACLLIIFASLLHPSNAEEELSQIQDSKARAAAEAIQNKLSRVVEFACHAEFTDRMLQGKPGEQRPVEVAARSQIKFRRPNLAHHRSETLKHVGPWLEGQVTDTYYDGTYWWQYQQPAPDSAEKLADMKKMPAGFERNLYVESHSKPKIYRHELSAFLDAELGDVGRNYGDIFVLRPFEHCDLPSLAIENEDNEVWVFSAEPRRVYGVREEYTKVRITVGKADGVMREQYYERNEDLNRTVTITNVQLNPGFDDSVFQFTPPDGVKVNTDWTDRLVQSLLSQRENWEQRNASAENK